MGTFTEYFLSLKEKECSFFLGNLQLSADRLSITGLHVCSLEWLDHPYVPVPRSPPALLELSHCQVTIPSLIVLSHSHWPSTTFMCGECTLTFTCVLP